jgi:hypothetical protein
VRALGKGVETPAGVHKGAGVLTHRCRPDVVPRADRVVEAGARLTRTLRNVFGHVRGHSIVVRSVAVGAKSPGIDLCTPAEFQLPHRGAVRRTDKGPPRRSAHGIDQHFRSTPGRGFVERTVRSVDADYGVHVDGRTLLVLGYAGEREPVVSSEVGLHEASREGKAPPDVDGEPVPQFGCVRLPEHMCRVVVAVGAQRFADQWCIRGVIGAAAQRPPVFAEAASTSGAAYVACPMDRTE